MKILYAEPEATTREFITEVISQENTEIEVCTSSAEALQFLDFEVYDLIITDFRLPQNGGVNILRKLIKNKQYPKLVYFSSVRPRKSKNLRKLLKRQNIFYVPRGMTSISINGLTKEINNFEAGLYQRMFEAFMFQKAKSLNSDKMVVKDKKVKKALMFMRTGKSPIKMKSRRLKMMKKSIRSVKLMKSFQIIWESPSAV